MCVFTCVCVCLCVCVCIFVCVYERVLFTFVLSVIILVVPPLRLSGIMAVNIFTYKGDDLFAMGPVTVRHGVTYKAAFLNAPRTVPEFYSQCFNQFPTSEFIVDGKKRLTYAQVC